MDTNLTETVDIDHYGAVEVLFDYEDGSYTIQKITLPATASSSLHSDLLWEDWAWLEKEAVWALQCRKAEKG